MLVVGDAGSGSVERIWTTATSGRTRPPGRMSRVKERSSRGLQYAIVQGARIGDRGGSPCGEGWYDIEGSPVYTTPMRERGIEPRSLPSRSGGVPWIGARTCVGL